MPQVMSAVSEAAHNNKAQMTGGEKTMGHLTTRDAYKNLEDRINWFTQGAPPTETLYKILQVLYTEKEAKWAALLPVRPFTVKKAAKIWGTTEAKAEKFLDHLCDKALLVDSEYHGQRQFVMPPPMAGFIEFALMRTRGDIDQHYLSTLYYQYMNVEEDFIKDLFFCNRNKAWTCLCTGTGVDESSDESYS